MNISPPQQEMLGRFKTAQGFADPSPLAGGRRLKESAGPALVAPFSQSQTMSSHATSSTSNDMMRRPNMAFAGDLTSPSTASSANVTSGRSTPPAIGQVSPLQDMNNSKPKTSRRYLDGSSRLSAKEISSAPSNGGAWLLGVVNDTIPNSDTVPPGSKVLMGSGIIRASTAVPTSNRFARGPNMATEELNNIDRQSSSLALDSDLSGSISRLAGCKMTFDTTLSIDGSNKDNPKVKDSSYKSSEDLEFSVKPSLQLSNSSLRSVRFDQHQDMLVGSNRSEPVQMESTNTGIPLSAETSNQMTLIGRYGGLVPNGELSEDENSVKAKKFVYQSLAEKYSAESRSTLLLSHASDSLSELRRNLVKRMVQQGLHIPAELLGAKPDSLPPQIITTRVDGSNIEDMGPWAVLVSSEIRLHSELQEEFYLSGIRLVIAWSPDEAIHLAHGLRLSNKVSVFQQGKVTESHVLDVPEEHLPNPAVYGRESLRKYSQPHVVLLDAGTPSGQPWKIFDRLHSLNSTRGIPTVMILKSDQGSPFDAPPNGGGFADGGWSSQTKSLLNRHRQTTFVIMRPISSAVIKALVQDIGSIMKANEKEKMLAFKQSQELDAAASKAAGRRSLIENDVAKAIKSALKSGNSKLIETGEKRVAFADQYQSTVFQPMRRPQLVDNSPMPKKYRTIDGNNQVGQRFHKQVRAAVKDFYPSAFQMQPDEIELEAREETLPSTIPAHSLGKSAWSVFKASAPGLDNATDDGSFAGEDDLDSQSISNTGKSLLHVYENACRDHLVRADLGVVRLLSHQSAEISHSTDEEPSARPLFLNGRGIGASGCHAVSAALMAGAVCSEIDLSNNSLDAAAMATVSTGLLTQHRCHALSLAENPLIGPDGGARLAPYLSSTRCKLSTINLNGCCLQDRGIKSVAAALCNCVTLTSLSLQRNSMSDASGPQLARVLRASGVNIKNLDISKNEIRSIGATSLCDALRSGCSLKSLKASFNVFGDRGATALATALGSNATLSHVSIAGNSIGASGGMALAQALERNNSVNEVTLDGNFLGSRAARAVCISMGSYNAQKSKDAEMGGDVACRLVNINLCVDAVAYSCKDFAHIIKDPTGVLRASVNSAAAVGNTGQAQPGLNEDQQVSSIKLPRTSSFKTRQDSSPGLVNSSESKAGNGTGDTASASIASRLQKAKKLITAVKAVKALNPKTDVLSKGGMIAGHAHGECTAGNVAAYFVLESGKGSLGHWSESVSVTNSYDESTILPRPSTKPKFQALKSMPSLWSEADTPPLASLLLGLITERILFCCQFQEHPFVINPLVFALSTLLQAVCSVRGDPVALANCLRSFHYECQTECAPVVNAVINSAKNWAKVFESVDELHISQAVFDDAEIFRSSVKHQQHLSTQLHRSSAGARAATWMLNTKRSRPPRHFLYKLPNSKKAQAANGAACAAHKCDSALFMLQCVAEISSIQSNTVRQMLEIAVSKGVVNEYDNRRSTGGSNNGNSKAGVAEADIVEIINSVSLDIAGIRPFFPVCRVGEFHFSLSHTGEKGYLQSIIQQCQDSASYDLTVHICKDVQRNQWMTMPTSPKHLSEVLLFVSQIATKSVGKKSTSLQSGALPVKAIVSVKRSLSSCRCVLELHKPSSRALAAEMMCRSASFRNQGSEALIFASIDHRHINPSVDMALPASRRMGSIPQLGVFIAEYHVFTSETGTGLFGPIALDLSVPWHREQAKRQFLEVCQSLKLPIPGLVDKPSGVIKLTAEESSMLNALIPQSDLLPVWMRPPVSTTEDMPNLENFALQGQENSPKQSIQRTASQDSSVRMLAKQKSFATKREQDKKDGKISISISGIPIVLDAAANILPAELQQLPLGGLVLLEPQRPLPPRFLLNFKLTSSMTIHAWILRCLWQRNKSKSDESVHDEGSFAPKIGNRPFDAILRKQDIIFPSTGEVDIWMRISGRSIECKDMSFDLSEVSRWKALVDLIQSADGVNTILHTLNGAPYLMPLHPSALTTWIPPVEGIFTLTHCVLKESGASAVETEFDSFLKVIQSQPRGSGKRLHALNKLMQQSTTKFSGMQAMKLAILFPSEDATTAADTLLKVSTQPLLFLQLLADHHQKIYHAMQGHARGNSKMAHSDGKQSQQTGQPPKQSGRNWKRLDLNIRTDGKSLGEGIMPPSLHPHAPQGKGPSSRDGFLSARRPGQDGVQMLRAAHLENRPQSARDGYGGGFENRRMFLASASARQNRLEAKERRWIEGLLRLPT